MNLYLTGVVLIFTGGLLSLFLPQRLKGWFVMLLCAAGVVPVTLSSVPVILHGGGITGSLRLAPPVGQITLSLDALSALFALLISLGSLLSSIYSASDTENPGKKKIPRGSYFFFLAVMQGSMLLLVTVTHALAFLIVWEIMSLASFFLVTFSHDKEGVSESGLYYLVMMHVGVLFMTAGFIFLGTRSGGLEFDGFKQVLSEGSGASVTGFVLLFTGFATKAGFFPVHTWLPRAYTAAPNHVSGLMSGVMSKTGLYGILRVIVLTGVPRSEISGSILLIATVTCVAGVALAALQKDLKKLLAYSSIENMGIIGMGIACALMGLSYNIPFLTVLGFSSALLHAVNHSLFKPLLFFASGNVYNSTGETSLEKLGGLGRTMPVTSASFLAGSIAISGLPPFNGFASEFMLYWAFIQGIISGNVFVSTVSAVCMGMLAFAGGMALLAFTKATGIAFLGLPRSEGAARGSEGSLLTRIPFYIQIAIMTIIGIMPALAFRLLSAPVSLLAGADVTLWPQFARGIEVLTSLSKGLLILAGLIAGLLVLRSYILKKRSVTNVKTWDCGYQAGTPRIQYTGSSFSSPLARVIPPLFQFNARRTGPAGIFPKTGLYTSEVEDTYEKRFIEPLVEFIQKVLNSFTWIQSGSAQQYILYQLFYLIAISIWFMVI